MGLRVLVMTNLYPPHYIGGYELVCLDVVNYLRNRGHAVTVLTSTYGLARPRVDGEVHRVLAFPQPATLSRRELIQREWRHRQAFRRALAEAKPDVIHVFSLYGVPQSLLYAAHRSGVPVVYDFSAEWLSLGCLDDLWVRFWAAPAGRPYRQASKAVVRRVLDLWLPTGRECLDLSCSYFTSRRIREIFVGKGFPVADAAIIYRGVDLGRFHPETRQVQDGPVRLLFAGRLARDKGFHTVVEAMEIMARAGTVERVALSAAGLPQDPEYLAGLQRTLHASSLREHVRFLGQVPWERMPDLYRDHDVYLLPSVFEEPFSIGLLEAMASGLAVVGTMTGGSREVLVDEENSLTFPAENAPALAAQLQRVLDPALRARLAAAGRRTVEQRFPLDRILSEIEAFLQNAVARHRAGWRGGWM